MKISAVNFSNRNINGMAFRSGTSSTKVSNPESQNTVVSQKSSLEDLKKINDKIMQLKGDNLYKRILIKDIDETIPMMPDTVKGLRINSDEYEVFDILKGKPEIVENNAGNDRKYTYIAKRNLMGYPDYVIVGYGNDKGCVEISDEIKPDDVLIKAQSIKGYQYGDTVKDLLDSIPVKKDRWNYGSYTSPSYYEILSVSKGQPKPVDLKMNASSQGFTYLMKTSRTENGYPEYRVMGYGNERGWVGLNDAEVLPDDIIITAREVPKHYSKKSEEETEAHSASHRPHIPFPLMRYAGLVGLLRGF